MLTEDAARVVGILQMVYPDSFRNKSDDELKAYIILFGEMFEADPTENVLRAIKAIIVTDASRFMPPIGLIKQKLWEQSHQDIMTEQKAWSLVQKALCNSLYNSKTEFDKLPSSVQKTVGSASQLRDWACMSTEVVESVVASNFMRSYRVIQKREEEMQKLPPSIRDVIGTVANNVGALDTKQERNVLPCGTT